MFEVQLYAKDTQGSLQAIQMAPEGGTLLTGLDISDVTLDTVQVSGAIDSVNLTQTLGNATVVGTGYQDNALRVVEATDSTVSTQAKLIARQTNPTAVADAATVFASADDLGRQITRPYQARDLITSAYASLTTGSKTSLITGIASTFFDLIQITCYNNSDAATVVTLTDESTTVRTIPVPANNVTNLNYIIPIKQSATGVDWYVDLPDITGTTIEVTADFVREV